MGALCSGCNKRGKRRVGVEDLPPQLRSIEILNELRAIGMITAATSGGVTYDIQPDGRIQANVPRRLPALQSERNRAHGGQVALSSKERTQRADERRQQALDERRKMGREFNKKKEAVLQRRQDLLLAKIKRTEAKLRRRTENL